jgi:hypothetical protein
VAFAIHMASTKAGLQWGTLAPVLATVVAFVFLLTGRKSPVQSAEPA